jgi:hypothetical protein
VNDSPSSPPTTSFAAQQNSALLTFRFFPSAFISSGRISLVSFLVPAAACAAGVDLVVVSCLASQQQGPISSNFQLSFSRLAPGWLYV